MDRNEIPFSIFLDLSKAFDTLDHTMLLQNLKYYGIDGKALHLCESYLTNRTQYVEINGVKSGTLPITTGVPQGSILGTLLFIIYINDFSRASQAYMSTQREVLEGQTGATERSEPTSEGGSGGPPPENFKNLHGKWCNLRYS